MSSDGSAGVGNIVLVGPRAAGKSSVGRALADALGAAFVDLDDELARRAGRPASEVLAEDGEPAFRRRERDVLTWAAGLREHVVATGGGAVLHEKAFARLAATGVVVYLRPERDVLVERQRRAPRPPLVHADVARDVDALLAARDGSYRAAAQIVVAGDVAVSILERLRICARRAVNG